MGEIVVSPTVLAIDPGRVKCGLAVVSQDGTILHRAIVDVDALIEQTTDLIGLYHPLAVICGDGTGAKPIMQALQAASLPILVQSVNEAHT